MAWLVSCALHGLLLTLALWGFKRGVDEPPPTIRLVFVEPPPPPPAPVGAPAATGTTPTPALPAMVEEKPKEKKTSKPKKKKPRRLTVAKKKKKTRPDPPPQPQPEPLASVEPAGSAEVAATDAGEPQPGVAAGTTAGVPKGVVGGVAGGTPGGVIGGQGSGPLPVHQVANPPLLIARVMQEYPRQARRQSVEGLVLLEAILDREGRIEQEIKVLHSMPPLDEAAIQALRQWCFRPARDHRNQPVRVILEVPIRFVLK